MTIVMIYLIMPLKIKFYLSDDGFGHIVRQEAIIKGLFTLRNDLDIVIQTESKIDVVKEKFSILIIHMNKNVILQFIIHK